MLRFVGHALGQVEKFAIEEAPRPEPAPDEVRIRVGAVALGYVDALIMRGLYQVKPSLPFVPGGEIVGTIDACGSNVEGWAVGERVATWQFGGGLAHYTTCLAADLNLAPAALDDAACAALILDYLTAYYGLFDRGDLQPGQRVLVLGAAGGVGMAATQLAVASGALVVGSASSSRKREFVEGLGAVHVLDSREVGWRNSLKLLLPSGVDRVFDPVGSNAFEEAFRSLAKQGRYLVVGFAAGEGIPKLPVNLPLLKSAELVGVDSRYLAQTNKDRVTTILRRVFELAEAGLIEPCIAGEFSLAETPAAFAKLADHSRVGKCVVRPNRS